MKIKMTQAQHNINIHQALELIDNYMTEKAPKNAAMAQYYLCVLLNETAQAWIKHFLSLHDTTVSDTLQAFGDFLSEVTFDELGDDAEFMKKFKQEAMAEKKNSGVVH